MKAQADTTQDLQKDTVQRIQRESGTGGNATIADDRPTTAVQRKLRSGIDRSEHPRGTIQQKTNEPGQKNTTGLPDNLKSGIENLSGHSMDDVKVHYNSSRPAQLQAHAYAQGTDIHLAPGQERHLPHEAWHVVQQKQGRVRPTMQFKRGVNINDNAGLEKEADAMGQRALKQTNYHSHRQSYDRQNYSGNTVQLRKKVETNRLNVIGETHGELPQEEEKKFARQKFNVTHDPYWEEFNFYGKDTDGNIDGGESILIRFVWDLKGFTKNVKENSDKKPQEAFFDFISTKNFFSGFYFKNLKLAIGHNANNEAGLAGRLLHIMNSYKALSPKDDNSNKKADLYSKYLQLETKIIGYWKEHNYFKEPLFKQFLDTTGENADKNLKKARSVIMFHHAHRYSGVRGIWKIGQNHVEDIRDWYPDEDKLPFNLIDKKDWKVEFKKWERQQKKSKKQQQDLSSLLAPSPNWSKNKDMELNDEDF